MAATVLIREKNGAGQTPTDKTAGYIRFKKADDANVDLLNPLVVPTSGFELSYEKWLRMYISVVPGTQIDNLRMYTDGSNTYGTGIKLFAAPIAAYATPVIPVTTNDPPQHAGTTFVDAFTHTSGSPRDMDNLNAGPFTSIGDMGNYLILVMQIATTASQGVKSAESLTFAWDEV